MNNLPRTRKEQEVWQACDDLLAIGKNVKEITGEAIAVRLRELKYKAGSTTQRYQYRDTWMAARGLSRDDLTSLQPNEFTDPIARATAVFKEGLERELKKEYEKKYLELQEALAAKQSEIEQLQSTISELQNNLQQEQANHTALQERYAIQSKSYQDIHEQNISYKSKITELEKQVASQQSLINEINEKNEQQQKQTLDNFHVMLATIKQETAQRITEIKDAAENQRHHYIVENDDLKIKNEKYKEELRCYIEKLMTANEKCLSLKQQLQTQDGFSVFKKHYENLEVTQKKILNSFEKNAFYISNIYDKQELFEHRINDFFSNMKMSLINSSKHRYHENKQDSDVIININEE